MSDVIAQANAALLRELDRARERLEGATRPADRAEAARDVAAIALVLGEVYARLAHRGRRRA